MKIITKSIPIYFGYFRIVITKDFEKAVKKLKVDCKGHNVANYSAFTDTDKTKKNISRYSVFLSPKSNHSVIAHECVHLVNALFLDVNMQLDRHNDEAQAYLTGWFVSEVYKTLKLK